MLDAEGTLRLLQHGDSFFPSGAASFSWGLETLTSEGLVSCADQVEEFLRGQITGRWADFDRAVVAAAHPAAPDLAEVAVIDRLFEAQILPLESREGSRKSGLALLSVHCRLETPGARAYQERTRRNEALGHLAAVQGLLWRQIGLGRDEALLLSAHQLSIGLLGAALRLGIIGHTVGQQILASSHQDIAAIVEHRPIPDLAEISAFSPESEIAVMRHEAALSAAR